MQVILQEDISALGKAGEVVSVKPGFARNFLLPQKKAVLADAGNLKVLEHFRKVATAKQAKLKADATLRAADFKGLVLTIEAEAGEEGKLFGSVTVNDIVANLKAQGKVVEKNQLLLKEHIKQLGSSTVDIRLHSEVIVPVTVTVVERAK